MSENSSEKNKEHAAAQEAPPAETKGTQGGEEKKEIEQLHQQLAEQKNRLLRALADFDNYKKRAAQEKEQFLRFANESLITDLLPILDSFSHALAAADKANAGEEMVKGLALIKKQMEDILAKHGLQEIKAVGQPFDPQYHEAIMQKEDAGPAGMVLEEVQKGYTLHGKLIRPSMVIVSHKK